MREQALDAWSEALRARGGEVFDANSSLLAGARVVTVDQQRVLLRNGLGKWFWDQLTITGKIEARGRLLADIAFADLQPVIVDDISEMAIGHLGGGLLVAHGLDEGGQPDLGIGGHDVMWFLARDLAFGEDAYADAEPPDNIGRPDAGTRLMPELPPEIEGLISLIANLLIIEFRAELGFAEAQAILRSPDVFVDRRDDAELAAEIIERIRTDELIHVRSLCVYLGELRSVTFRTNDGGTDQRQRTHRPVLGRNGEVGHRRAACPGCRTHPSGGRGLHRHASASRPGARRIRRCRRLTVHRHAMRRRCARGDARWLFPGDPGRCVRSLLRNHRCCQSARARGDVRRDPQ